MKPAVETTLNELWLDTINQYTQVSGGKQLPTHIEIQLKSAFVVGFSKGLELQSRAVSELTQAGSNVKAFNDFQIGLMNQVDMILAEGIVYATAYTPKENIN